MIDKNMRMGLACLAVFALAALAVPAFVAAADNTSVIITTNRNYPDTMVAAAAAEKIGAPLLLTDPGRISAETLAEVQSLGATSVYIIGGPSAVAEDVENGLGANVTVTRLWGMTRYGTGAEVALYFWDSSDKAVLVVDALAAAERGNAELVAQAKELAIAEAVPLMLINKEYVPPQVVSALTNLSVKSVVLVGNTNSRVRSELAALGINVSEEIKGTDLNDTIEHLKEKVKEKVKENIEAKGKRPLVVIAVGNWSDIISAPYMPNGTSRLISSEGQIAGLIDEIKQYNYTRIFVVGKPDLARIIYDRLTEANITVTHVSGNIVSIAKQIMEREKDAIFAKAKAVNQALKSIFMAKVSKQNLPELSAKFITAAERLLTQARVADRASIIETLNETRDDMIAKIEAGDNEGAWKDFVDLQMYAARLTIKYRSLLADKLKELSDQETRYRTAAGMMNSAESD